MCVYVRRECVVCVCGEGEDVYCVCGEDDGNVCVPTMRLTAPRGLLLDGLSEGAEALFHERTLLISQIECPQLLSCLPQLHLLPLQIKLHCQIHKQLLLHLPHPEEGEEGGKRGRKEREERKWREREGKWREPMQTSVIMLLKGIHCRWSVPKPLSTLFFAAIHLLTAVCTAPTCSRAS